MFEKVGGLSSKKSKYIILDVLIGQTRNPWVKLSIANTILCKRNNAKMDSAYTLHAHTVTSCLGWIFVQDLGKYFENFLQLKESEHNTLVIAYNRMTKVFTRRCRL